MIFYKKLCKLIALVFFFLLLNFSFGLAVQVDAACNATVCAQLNASCQGRPIESSCTRSSCSGGGSDCLYHESPPSSNIVWGCSCSGSGTVTPTPPPGTPTPPTSTGTFCPMGGSAGGGYTFTCVSSTCGDYGYSFASGYYCNSGQCCIRPAPTSGPVCGDGSCDPGESCVADCGGGPTSPPPPPAAYCGDLVCNGTDYCGNCPGDCGSCCAAACGGASCSSCGGGYCCGGEGCAGGGGCPAGYPYVGNGVCSAGPCVTPTPMVCPNVGFGSSPGSYCGAACLGCGITSDRYYDASCNCVQQGGGISTPSCQQFCAPTPTPTVSTETPCPNSPGDGSTNACRYACLPGESVYGNPSNNACRPAYGGTICCNSRPTPTPTTTPSGGCVTTCLLAGNTVSYCYALCGITTPTPTTPPVGSCPAGSYSTSCLCNGNCALGGQNGCCANGTTCSSVAGGTYACTIAPTSPPPPPPPSTIQGYVFYDTNYNGSISGGESGAPSVSLQATGCSSSFCDTRSALTDFVGNFTMTVSFAGVPYTVTPFAPSGYNVVPVVQNVFAPASNVGFALQQQTVIGGSVYIDTDRDGSKDASEVGYNNAVISISTGDCADNSDNDGDGTTDKLDSRCHTDNNAGNIASYDPSRRENGSGTTAYANSTNFSGVYTRTITTNATYQVYLTVPSGYVLTSTTNPFRFTTTGGTYPANFGINVPPPFCPGGLTANPPNTVQPGATSILSVTNCQNVPTPTPSLPPPVLPTPTTVYHWDPDITPPPPGNIPSPTLGPQVDTPPPAGNPPGSRIPWTAPTCQNVQKTYHPQVIVGNAGNSTPYSTAITVPPSYTLTTHVRSVTDVTQCDPSKGTAYKSSSGVGATLHIEGGPTFTPRNQTTTGTDTGTPFTCLPTDNYLLTLNTPDGYTIVGRDISTDTYSPLGSFGMFINMDKDKTATFCIAPLDPWFQTDKGDVRYSNLSNPVPSGKYASSDLTYPGIFYSSDSPADLGISGAVSSSIKQWVISDEYSYNKDTENRNGGMSYSFFKSKALKDGVTIRTLPGTTFDQSSIAVNEKVIYETNGDFRIDSYTHPIGRNIVILVKGKATIGGNISVPTTSQGVFIVAAKTDIEILSNVGTPDPINTTTLAQTTTNLDGYYTAQGSITIETLDITGKGCSAGTNSDRRLNVGGALIANSLKPFASTTTGGKINNKRSLCVNNLTIPSLYIASRPDFLVRLTDFYKTSYTKWKEINP